MPDKEQAIKAAGDAARRLTKWMRQVKGNQVAQAEALSLRRDMVALLTYLRDKRVRAREAPATCLSRRCVR